LKKNPMGTNQGTGHRRDRNGKEDMQLLRRGTGEATSLKGRVNVKRSWEGNLGGGGREGDWKKRGKKYLTIWTKLRKKNRRDMRKSTAGE